MTAGCLFMPAGGRSLPHTKLRLTSSGSQSNSSSSLLFISVGPPMMEMELIESSGMADQALTAPSGSDAMGPKA